MNRSTETPSSFVCSTEPHNRASRGATASGTLLDDIAGLGRRGYRALFETEATMCLTGTMRQARTMLQSD